jgi:hypothetical protein
MGAGENLNPPCPGSSPRGPASCPVRSAGDAPLGALLECEFIDWQ